LTSVNASLGLSFSKTVNELFEQLIYCFAK